MVQLTRLYPIIDQLDYKHLATIFNYQKGNFKTTNNSNDDIDQQYLDYVENRLLAIESSITDIR